jgi:hypothetical protein
MPPHPGAIKVSGVHHFRASSFRGPPLPERVRVYSLLSLTSPSRRLQGTLSYLWRSAEDLLPFQVPSGEVDNLFGVFMSLGKIPGRIDLERGSAR